MREGAEGSGTRSVLYVDDEEHNLTVFEAGFGEDFDVFVASSGEKALELLRDHDIQVVITDQMMPGMSGVELLEEILNEYPEIVRILLTAYSEIDVVIQAINRGEAFQYVTKPWDEQRFKIIIKQALEDYDLRRSNRRILEEVQQTAAREEEIRRAFQRYVPASVVDEILAEGSHPGAQGEHRIVGLLYSEILGFTRVTSGHEPQTVVTFLNRYCELMHGIIVRHHGIVRDDLLAVFGAGDSRSARANAAVAAALEMVAALEDFNREVAIDLLGEEVSIGIGVHHGEVVAGSVGSSEKREYMVIGDPVNTSARIQGLTCELPNSILVSQAVYEKTEQLIEVEALAPVLLRGRNEESQLYRVLGRR